ncbi:MAG: cbb3-type cytochrome c oxidase N-terminal domain-containing protein [Bacteroidota bacterium]|nr:cbb3-type cytochrome c oxidase N-terminal domain-containing protein [Bacteroidota bacterium]
MHTNDEDQLNKQEEIHHEVDDATQIKYFGGDHEYDGIKELDNPLPPWLKYLFYVTIVIAFSYMMLIFVFEDDDFVQHKEYRKEMIAARAKTDEAVNEEATKAATVAPPSKEEILAAGKTIFDKTCLVCHGKFGEGLVGPNFTDDYWIHGGNPEDLLKVVNEGVIEKGMISYKSQLNKTQINNVIQYILSLQGTNPPNQKAPEGEKFVKN